MRAGLAKPRLLILGSQVAQAGVVTDLREVSAASFLALLLYKNVNVASMSWPVRYSEVATLAQDFLEGLSLPTSNWRDGGQAPAG